MNTEERLAQIEQDLERVLALWDKENWGDRMVLYRYLILKDRNNGTVLGYDSNGINLGSAGGKVGLYGETPVTQAGAITAPTGGVTVDAEARTAINSIRTALTNIGVTA